MKVSDEDLQQFVRNKDEDDKSIKESDFSWK